MNSRSFFAELKRLEIRPGPIKVMNKQNGNHMSQDPTKSKRLLSQVIAEWACSLKYQHLSPEAIQAAKLFWFDSIGCALGGSRQEDARILLKHYRAMSATADSSGGEGGGASARSHARSNGGSDRHQRRADVLSGRGHSGQVDQHEEHGRSVGRPHGRRERVARARRFLRTGTHDRWERRFVCGVQS